MSPKHPAIVNPSRRSLLQIGGTGLGALALTACGMRSDPSASDNNAVSADNCLTPIVRELTPQTTEGPYYFDPDKVRRDITEGMPGIPIDVVFNVVDAKGMPHANARVDIWHCNAAGLYSGYAGQGDDRQADTTGETFLRGTQHTDAQGKVAFASIYPGWYRGRTTHIHFKVFSGDTAVLTCQFFLPDALSEYLYTHVPDYQRQALRDVLNSNDGIALQAGELTDGHVKQVTERYVVELTVAVDPSATPSVDRPGMGGGGGARPDAPPPGQRPDQRIGSGGPPPMQAALTGQERVDAIVPNAVPNTYRKP